MTPHRWFHLIIAGSLWGGLAYFLGARAMGPSIWGGVIASPIIALLVGRIMQPLFDGLSGFPRGAAVLASVYLGATLFGLAVGLFDWAVRHQSHPAPAATVFQALLGAWWGTTITGFILFLWPLAYLTHALLKWYDEG